LTKWEVGATVKQAQRIGPLQPEAILICWDLDNTLVNSGKLVRVGMPLHEAVIEAQPVPNMLEFYEALHEQIPRGEHVILSARPRSMRPDTLAWLDRHGVMHKDSAICFVPSAEAKPDVWRTFARAAPLVIVDDLSYNHESDQASVYHELVRVAERTASVYIGLDEISCIAADAGAVGGVVARTIESLPIGRGR
jgi:hypothetical protein